MGIDFKKPYVAYVGHMLFPWGQAASRRVFGNAMSLVNRGYQVVVASGSSQPERVECCENVEGLFHVGLGGSPMKGDSSWVKACKLLFTASQRTISWLDSQPVKPSHIILYGGYTPYLLRLLPWCRHHNVALIADLVEWQNASQLPGGALGLSSININLAMRFLYPKCDGIISISSYLSKYYMGRGCRVVQVPPTLDTSLSPLPIEGESEHRFLTLVYAGDPGKKDLLQPVIDGIKIADPYSERLRLIVLGPTEQEVSSICCNGESVPSFVTVKGRVPQDEVAAILKSADFSVLMRPNMRFANAGFPTKFVESLSNGIPVIANHTSDLGLYLRDKVEGIVVSDCTAYAFSVALKRVLNLSADELYVMKKSAYLQSRNSFDFRKYSDSIAELLELAGASS